MIPAGGAAVTSSGVRRRGGLPRLRERAEQRRELHVAAFGSSITHDGYYLPPLTQALESEFPGVRAGVVTRALPGFMSYWAVFRAAAIGALEPDLAIVEFAVNDHTMNDGELTSRSIEGIVRRLRSGPNPPDVLFVYFMSRLAEAVPREQEIIALWERVADHYEIPSIDCSKIAENLVRSKDAVWLDRWPGKPSWDAAHPSAMTRDLTHHTPYGGKLLGEHIARAVLEAMREAGEGSYELPPPLHADHYADARTLYPADLARAGWSVRRLDDTETSQLPVMYFSELLLPATTGSVLKLQFTGRQLNIWAQSAPGNIVRLDGAAGPLHLPDPRIAFPVALLRDGRSASHTFEIEVREMPFALAAIDLMGEVWG